LDTALSLRRTAHKPSTLSASPKLLRSKLRPRPATLRMGTTERHRPTTALGIALVPSIDRNNASSRSSGLPDPNGGFGQERTVLPQSGNGRLWREPSHPECLNQRQLTPLNRTKSACRDTATKTILHPTVGVKTAAGSVVREIFDPRPVVSEFPRPAAGHPQGLGPVRFRSSGAPSGTLSPHAPRRGR